MLNRARASISLGEEEKEQQQRDKNSIGLLGGRTSPGQRVRERAVGRQVVRYVEETCSAC